MGCSHTFSEIKSPNDSSAVSIGFLLKPYRQQFLIHILTIHSNYSLPDIADYLTCDLCLLKAVSQGKQFLCQSHANKLVELFFLFCEG